MAISADPPFGVGGVIGGSRIWVRMETDTDNSSPPVWLASLIGGSWTVGSSPPVWLASLIGGLDLLCLERCTKTLSHLLPKGTGEVGLHVYQAPLGCPTMGTDRVGPYSLAHPAGQTCREGRPSHPLRLGRR